jgi:hypothetical protein
MSRDEMTINIDHLTESELIHLNEKIVQRLRIIRQMRAHVQMLDFTLGDRVWFQTDRQGIVEGTLVRYNKKSVTVLTDEGHRWNVSPGFLRKIIRSSHPTQAANVISMTKANPASNK